MKKILALLLVFLMATAVMVACGDDTKPDNNASASGENHPDAVNAANHLNMMYSAITESPAMKMSAHAEASGNKVIVTVVMDANAVDSTESWDTTKEYIVEQLESSILKNPFENSEMASRYPGVEAFEFAVKLSNDEVLHTKTFTR